VSATLGIRAFGTTVTLDITAMHSMAAAESSLAQFFGGTPDKNRVDRPVAQRYAFKSWAMTPAAWQYSL
jgi:hypothetical protein